MESISIYHSEKSNNIHKNVIAHIAFRHAHIFHKKMQQILILIL